MPTDREKLEQLFRETGGRGRVGEVGRPLGKSEYFGEETSRGILAMPEGMSLPQIRAWKKARDKELARLEAEKEESS